MCKKWSGSKRIKSRAVNTEFSSPPPRTQTLQGVYQIQTSSHCACPTYDHWHCCLHVMIHTGGDHVTVRASREELLVWLERDQAGAQATGAAANQSRGWAGIWWINLSAVLGQRQAARRTGECSALLFTWAPLCRCLCWDFTPAFRMLGIHVQIIIARIFCCLHAELWGWVSLLHIAVCFIKPYTIQSDYDML